jgi:hypothetical protein
MIRRARDEDNQGQTGALRRPGGRLEPVPDLWRSTGKRRQPVADQGGEVQPDPPSGRRSSQFICRREPRRRP